MGSLTRSAVFVVLSFVLSSCYGILIPKHYDLHLVVDPFNKTLSGSVKIKIHAENKTDIVQLSADPSIVVKNVTILPENATGGVGSFIVTKIEKIKPDGLNIHVNQKLTKNRTFIILVRFEAIKPQNTSANSSIYAFNVTSRNHDQAKTNKTTSFFVIDLTKNSSKAVFPCIFDSLLSPHKATFNLTIARPKSYKLVTISRSNISHIQSTQRSDYYEDTYWQTIPISVRSFALIASNDSEIYQVGRQENGTCSSKPVPYGLNRDMLVCMMDYLSAFYGTLMPGNGMTIIVIPRSANISIEAFSLVTVSQCNPNASSVHYTLEHLVYILSSQWITYRVHSINPNASAMIQSLKSFAMYDITPKLIQKSNASKFNDFYDMMTSNAYHSLIRKEWNRNQNISGCYFVFRDVLVFNMLKAILGPKLFSEGLGDLLSKSNHNPIKDDDIWRHLTHIAMKYEALDVPDFPQSVEEIVKPFINNSLFSIPLLEFDFDFYGSFGGFIRQIPYAYTSTFFDSKLYANVTGSPLWKVPIQLILENENFTSQQKSFVWAKTRNRAIALTNFSQKEILLLNSEIRGPYIVKYRKSNWDMVFEKFESLPLKYRTLLLIDLHVLAHSYHYNYTEYIKYLPKLKPTEKNLPVWKTFVNLIGDIETRLFGNAKKLVTKMFVKQLTAVYEKFLNKTQTDFWMNDLRESVQKYLCNNGAAVCNRTADYKLLLNNITKPDISLKLGSCGAMLNATYDQWYQVTKKVYAAYKNFSNCDRNYVMKILAGCTKNKQALNTFLKIVFQNHENSTLSLQNTPRTPESLDSLLYFVKKTDEGSAALFEFFAANFEDIKKKYPTHFKTILSASIKNLKCPEMSKKVIEFLKANSAKLDQDKNFVQENVQRLQEQQTWARGTQTEIEKFLNEVFKTPEKYFGY
ncbi:uncharacterized protein LOC135833944 [Planococcus citri]|uniref:uncharacterized protein LOC135833944 n=1 Tax=Planococcus citri TaxID=170843 RepID=UPI0031F850C1